MVRTLVNAIRIAIVVAGLGMSQEANAQNFRQAPAETMNLSGPRFGATFLSNGIRSKLYRDAAIDVGSVVSQFGWQKEKRFLASANGLTGVTEWVFLAGGVDQGVLVPSVSWLVGMRTIKGVEFAVGPNVTPAGLAMAGAAGVTFRAGNLNIPVNLAAVPSKSGIRVSVLAGFNTRQR